MLFCTYERRKRWICRVKPVPSIIFGQAQQVSCHVFTQSGSTKKKSSSWKSEWVHYARDSRFESRNLNWYSYYKVRVFWEGYKHLVQSSYRFWRYYFVAFSEHIYFKFNFQCCLCWGDLVEFSNFLLRILCIPKFCAYSWSPDYRHCNRPFLLGFSSNFLVSWWKNLYL